MSINLIRYPPLYSRVMDIKSVQRYNGRENIIETVGDHILGCQLLLFNLYYKLKEENEDYVKDIDLQKLIFYTFIHDLEESYTGDIPRDFKYYDGTQSASYFRKLAYKMISNSDDKHIIEALNQMDENSIEYKLLDLIDKYHVFFSLSILPYTTEEINQMKVNSRLLCQLAIDKLTNDIKNSEIIKQILRYFENI